MTATSRRAVVAEHTEHIDERSERWITAVHEAGHAVTVEQLGGRVLSCRVDARDPHRGNTRHTLEHGLARAVVAVAGERATRLICGTGGGSGIDYRDAAHALTGTGRDLAWAEHEADDILYRLRPELLRAGRRLYQRGQR